MDKMKFNICCICGEMFEGWGNNPAPVKEKGECCDNCNFVYVIPARLFGYRQHKKEEVANAEQK